MALLDRMRAGFLKKRKKHEKEIEDEVLNELENDSEEAFVNHQNFVVKKMKSNQLTVEEACRELISTNRQLDRRKIEYEQVTAYLTDIQLIDQMTDEEKDAAITASLKIAALTKDREDIKSEQESMGSLQRRFFELHEHEVDEGIHLMEEQEEFQAQVRNDLRLLDEEKVNLKYEERYYLEKLSNLRTAVYLIIGAAIVSMCFSLFMYTLYEFDILFLLLFIVFITALIGTLIFIRYRNINYALLYCRKQQGKAVQLINKVKVKWVNNAATLDYLYSKYNVMSSRELVALWEQYNIIKDNEEMYRRSSKELDHYGRQLVKVLQNIGVHDADIWINQPEAIIDPRELVEVTHGLNMRRQKLRTEMEVDEDMIDLATGNIRDRIKKHPEEIVIVRQLLEPHRIRVDLE
ncbi:MAG: hypothetical protein K5656_06150 [Lachnospiraceae bacterium]|nr:hypothetical protein [Lachnospiraceae bacterium]